MKKQVCVLGSGQLDDTFAPGGRTLGIAVWPVASDAEPPCGTAGVITAEVERWRKPRLPAS